MGCGNSKFDAIPHRLCPIFHGRLEEIKRRHARTLKDDQIVTSSKKGLLLHERDEVDASSHHLFNNNTKKESALPEDSDNRVISTVLRDNSEKLIEINSPRDDGSSSSTTTTKHQDGTRKEANGIQVGVENEEVEDIDEKDDDERMIRRQDEYDFPGSPSFRVYFSENLPDQRNDDMDDGLQETAPGKVITTSKESTPMEVPKARKRRSFRQVLTKGGVFNIRI